MEYTSAHFKRFEGELKKIAATYALNMNGLRVEFYMPGHQAIFTERIEDEAYRVHINLEENRIISIQRVSGNGKPDSEQVRKKYRQYMR
jgi:hypothetical protein